MTYDFNMKMHQFAFVQRCPALTSAALPPPPLYVQLTTNINHTGLQRTAKEYAEERRIYKELISKNDK